MTLAILPKVGVRSKKYPTRDETLPPVLQRLMSFSEPDLGRETSLDRFRLPKSRPVVRSTPANRGWNHRLNETSLQSIVAIKSFLRAVSSASKGLELCLFIYAS